MPDRSDIAIDGLEWPHAAASRFIEVEDFRWHVQQVGTGPAALLIHGTGASCHSWEGLCDALGSDLTSTIVDLPGHGFSQSLAAGEMTLAGIARRLGSLLDALNFQPRMIIGHSAGAAIAVRMALDGRLRAPTIIVGINGALLPFGGLARFLFPPMARVLAAGGIAARLLSRRAESPDAVARMLQGTGSMAPPRSVTFYERLLRRPSQVQAALDMMANWDLDALAGDLPRLATPLVLIACGEDRSVPPETAFSVRDVRPSTIVHYVRGLGHLAHEEDPAAIATIIRSIWRECEAHSDDATDGTASASLEFSRGSAS